MAKRKARRTYRVKGKLGTGARFKRLKKTLGKRKGVKNPAALAAAIGRKKLGNRRMAKLSARGRKRRR